MKYSMLLMKKGRRKTTTWSVLSGDHASAEEQRISLMQHREDVAIVAGSTLGRLGRLEKFTVIGVMLKIEQHSWLQHTMGRQDVFGC